MERIPARMDFASISPGVAPRGHYEGPRQMAQTRHHRFQVYDIMGEAGWAVPSKLIALLIPRVSALALFNRLLPRSPRPRPKIWCRRKKKKANRSNLESALVISGQV
jgi:hypothetical protein